MKKPSQIDQDDTKKLAVGTESSPPPMVYVWFLYGI